MVPQHKGGSVDGPSLECLRAASRVSAQGPTIYVSTSTAGIFGGGPQDCQSYELSWFAMLTFVSNQVASGHICIYIYIYIYIYRQVQ